MEIMFVVCNVMTLSMIMLLQYFQHYANDMPYMLWLCFNCHVLYIQNTLFLYDLMMHGISFLILL